MQWLPKAETYQFQKRHSWLTTVTVHTVTIPLWMLCIPAAAVAVLLARRHRRQTCRGFVLGTEKGRQKDETEKEHETGGTGSVSTLFLVT